MNAIGYEYFEQGNNAKAIIWFTKAIQTNPIFLRAHFNRCDAYEKMEKWDDVLRGYNRILEINPKCSYAYFGRSRLHTRTIDEKKLQIFVFLWH